jgi:menaquinol-cytochrome c reductase iron-sulfur subunit
MQRRTASGILVAAGSLLAGGAVGVPVLLSGLSPAMKSGGKRTGDDSASWRTLGRIDDFATGAMQLAAIVSPPDEWPRPVTEHAVYVWCKSADELIVFSRSCTDLGCPVEFDPKSKCFFCPCHGGVFDQHGSRLAGPPKTPLHRYAHRVREGLLEIDLSSVPPSA